MEIFDSKITKKDFENFTSDNIKNISYDNIKTGIESIDNATNGGFKTGITVLGATPGAGKSTLAFQIAKNVAKYRPVIIFSLEMSKNQILSKMIISQMYLDNPQLEIFVTESDLLNSIKNQDFQKELWDKIKETTKKLKNDVPNLYIVENINGISAQTIFDEVSNFIDKPLDNKNKYPKTPFVIVDYLQFLSPSQTNLHTDKQIADNSIAILKRLSTEYKISILLISSLSRTYYDKPIKMDAFKESGGIEYTAETLIGMRQISEQGKIPRLLELEFLKQRYGSQGVKVELLFDSSRGIIYEKEDKDTDTSDNKHVHTSKPSATSKGKASVNQAESINQKRAKSSKGESESQALANQSSDDVKRLFDSLKRDTK